MAYSFIYPPMCSQKKQPKNFSSQNFMKSGTPRFLNVPNALKRPFLMVLIFYFWLHMCSRYAPESLNWGSFSTEFWVHYAPGLHTCSQKCTQCPQFSGNHTVWLHLCSRLAAQCSH